MIFFLEILRVRFAGFIEQNSVIQPFENSFDLKPDIYSTNHLEWSSPLRWKIECTPQQTRKAESSLSSPFFFFALSRDTEACSALHCPSEQMQKKSKCNKVMANWICLEPRGFSAFQNDHDCFLSSRANPMEKLHREKILRLSCCFCNDSINRWSFFNAKLDCKL